MAGLHWSDAEVALLGEAFLARTLPEPEWTHQAHFAALVHLIAAHPEIDLDRQMPGLIWRYNVAVGTPNSETRGYHETITRFYLAAVPAFLARLPAGIRPGEAVTRLVGGVLGDVAFPLTYYRRETLLSLEARRVWVAPDRRAFDFTACPLEAAAHHTPGSWKPPRPRP